ncbi:hypothetical protein N7510_001456 [Penicillium lagena]|uniref:uncharacterized protein n=1 Tax=Penicillium lagena TaxID=94218 RepID=UPI002541E35A|nr:uncharacterized protein N7510_001456 [Penicillium lagena]KAJ5625147.1 hypothetical protein N7510_001456 [Penicillium lagena]
MESPTRPFLSPSKVLHPVSPERMNQQGLPVSPSLPTDLLSLHHKNTKGVSEVQAKVAFLNNLSRQGSPVSTNRLSAADNAALQRAVLGREEAESALASVSEQLSEAQSRERRISERLESLLEELHGTKERQAHERSIFEKEIRKARKEAFRAGSTLVKVQEEFKHSKSEVKALKDEVSAEREAKDQAKQEAFERAYALAGLTEELQMLKEKLRSVETDHRSSTLEIRAHEMRKEDVGRISLAEGDLAFLTTPRRPKRAAADSIRSPVPEREQEDIAENTPPKRQRLSDCASPVEKEVVADTDSAPSNQYQDELDDLKEELKYEKHRRVEAEEMIHFLNIECQFERCSCRIAESQGRPYIYDAEFFEKYQKPQLEEAARCSAERKSAESIPVRHANPISPPRPQPESIVKSEPADPPEKMQAPAEPLVTFSPETGTFRTFPSPLRDSARPTPRDSFATPELAGFHAGAHEQPSASSSAAPFDSFTPSGEPIGTSHTTPDITAEESHEPPKFTEYRPTRRPAERENYQHNSSTRRVPLRAEPEPHSAISDTPINREDALAQIRARRGRARSMKRSVSANEATGRSGSSSGSSMTTPGRGPRRVPNTTRPVAKSENDLGERRDLSAPVRMFRR